MLLKSASKYILLIVLAVILSVTTFVFGAVPMRAIYRAFGRVPFWTGLLLASITMAAAVSPAYGLLVLALAVMVGVYSEVEDHGSSVFTSGLVATLAAIGTSIIALGVWALETAVGGKSHLLDDIRAQITPLVDKVTAMNPNTKIDVDSLIQQLPSGLVIGLIVGLAIALLAENRMAGWFGFVPSRKPAAPLVAGARITLPIVLLPGTLPSLSSFRVPDAFIWITIASVFGAFFRHGNEMVELISVNALNVLAVVFFFQGIAIASHMFRAYKVSAFWQGLWYFILVLQLFFLVSLVGFADYWLDFRERLTRKPAETNKGF